jgi:DNA-binding FrmR family transcriptional regulator
VTAMRSGTATLDPVHARLHRIQGQTSALLRMYETGRPTTDLLDLIAAIRAALGGLGLALITEEAEGPGRRGQDTLAEDGDDVEAVLTLVRRLVRCT